MNELVNLNNNNVTMSSLEIAGLVESRHDHTKESIERLANQGVIVQPAMRDVQSVDALGRKRTTKVYLFSGEQGKRDSIIVVAQLSPQFTGKLVDRWMELEKQAQFNIPKTYPEALKLAYEQSLVIEEQQKQLAKQQPAVEFVDRYVEAKSTKSIREVAKILQYGERKFVKYLLDNAILFRQGVTLLPYAYYQHNGYFTVKTGEDYGYAYHQTRFTPKGIGWIAQKLGVYV